MKMRRRRRVRLVMRRVAELLALWRVVCDVEQQVAADRARGSLPPPPVVFGRPWHSEFDKRRPA